MKLLSILSILATLISLSACHSDLLTKKYELEILRNSIFLNIPQFQNTKEIELFKNYKVKSISYLAYRGDSTDVDSLTYVEFDLDGKILRRTTTENTTQGCLPYMMRQEFSYSDSLIKQVKNYTFKFKASSVLENWMLKDTTKLILFDWEDYSYNGDTVIVESGAAINKFIKDKQGNIIKRNIITKTDNNLHGSAYKYNDKSVVVQFASPSYSDIKTSNYTVDKNIVRDTFTENDKEYRTEFSFDENGLLKSKTYYLNDEKQVYIVANYSYY